MILPIVTEPDQRLHQVAQPITEITDELIDLIENMFETMEAHDGIGIAAPQVGQNIQLAIVAFDELEPFVMLNPEIIAKSGKSIDVEGCLSIPHTYGTVERAEEITVRYTDPEGDEVEVDATDYLARAFQHEIDHLQGVLFTEKMLEQIPEEQLESYYEAREDELDD